MKILSIIAQKPNSTGSGIYLKELVRCFKEMGHEQEIICACYNNDEIYDEENVHYDKIVFDTNDVPIKIAGMSDVMPYDTIKYSDFVRDDKSFKIWENIFSKKIIEVLDRFKPDIIICHHLYLLTSMVVDIVKNNAVKIYGVCHNTDLRQYKQTNLKRDFIKNNLNKLDKVFLLHKKQKNTVKDLYGFADDKMKIIGIGYNDKIFYINAARRTRHYELDNKKLLYVGKVAKKKGVLSLVKAINKLEDKDIVLDIIGGRGDENEYNEIMSESKKSISQINFIEPMAQQELSKEYNNHNILILPSFSEGMPMVPIEAMACGMKVVISDLSGVREFYDENISDACIKYVELPKLTNVDEATISELEAFEMRLSIAIKDSISDNAIYEPKISNISWENIANQIID